MNAVSEIRPVVDAQSAVFADILSQAITGELIGLSCLFTKQHYVVDFPAGAGLGWFAHNLHVTLIAP